MNKKPKRAFALTAKPMQKVVDTSRFLWWIYEWIRSKGPAALTGIRHFRLGYLYEIEFIEWDSQGQLITTAPRDTQMEWRESTRAVVHVGLRPFSIQGVQPRGGWNRAVSVLNGINQKWDCWHFSIQSEKRSSKVAITVRDRWMVRRQRKPNFILSILLGKLYVRDMQLLIGLTRYHNRSKPKSPRRLCM